MYNIRICVKGVYQIVASELKHPIWHSLEWQIGSFSSEATRWDQFNYYPYEMFVSTFHSFEDGIANAISSFKWQKNIETCETLTRF